MNSSRDKKNLKQFSDVVKRAYAASKAAGNIPAQELALCDKLIACPAVAYPQDWGGNRGGWVRPVHAHRQWRRQVARMYRRERGRPIRGLFEFDFDWEAIMAWIIENIVPIVKMLLVIAPFII